MLVILKKNYHIQARRMYLIKLKSQITLEKVQNLKLVYGPSKSMICESEQEKTKLVSYIKFYITDVGFAREPGKYCPFLI